MSLRVWLPLNGDINNQGLDSSDVSITSAQGNIVDNGKIGKCFKTTTTGDISLNNSSKIINTNDMSFGGWFKFNKAEIQTALEAKTYTSSATAATGSLIGNSNYGGFGLIWNSNNMYSSSKVLSSINIFTNIRTSTSSKSTSSFAIDFDVWTHIFVTFNKVTNVLSLYKNGALYSSTTLAEFSDCVDRNICINYKGISGGNGPSASIPFYINDVRLYNNCLSAKEVKEISKGLVAHYKLDSRYITDNLIINGFGESNNENWTNSNISTTEIPPNHPEIKASFYNGNMTKEYIPLNQNHSYTISGYVKSSGATSGTTYPSIYPYDIDKKFIANQHTSAGFGSSYRTTLAQPLKKGDTIIYATDLSAWTTATNNHYYMVAIFGYKDSTGYVYPDMVYTQDCPAFGSYSDKSHIDKINNTITLNSAYTGEDRPAGTAICQATAGSIYYYPWGGLGLGGLQDWVFKTTTFIPKNVGRLKPCKYIRWSTYSNCYIAGNQLIDNDDNSNVVYDSSGYNYHGTPTGNLTVSADTARNSLSTIFNTSSTDTIQIPSIYSIGQSIEKLSVNIWFKTNTLNGTAPNLWSLGNNYFARIRLANSSSIWFYLNMGSSSTKKSATYNTKILTDNVWHNVIFVFNNGVVIIYLDGEQIGTSDFSSTATFLNVQHNGWYLAGYNATSEKFLGSLSDFRIYSTALSAEDVKELYQTSASIDKSGNVFAYEYKEG